MINNKDRKIGKKKGNQGRLKQENEKKQMEKNKDRKEEIEREKKIN